MDALRGEKGAKQAAETMGSGETSLGDALWCCANLYSDIKLRLSQKRVMIFTCRDEPHGGDSVKDRQARTKASDLKETGMSKIQFKSTKLDGETLSASFHCSLIVKHDFILLIPCLLGVIIDLMHLLKPGGFDVSSFFRDIISPPEDESELGLQLEPCDKLEDLQKRVRAKEQKKRALAR